MAKSHKGVGSFVVLAIVVYLLVKYWPTIKGAVAPALAQAGTPAPVATPAPANGQPGDPAYSATFGGSNAQFNGFNAPGFSFGGGPDAGDFTGRWGSGGGAIDYSYQAAANSTGPIASAFAPGCSTHLTDGKPLCE